MTIDNTILLIKRELIRAFAVLDAWFDKDESLHYFKTKVPSRDISEILESVMLATHCLLVRIDESGAKALQKALVGNLAEALADYKFNLDALQANVTYDSFEELLTKQTKLSDTKQLCEIRSELRDHLDRCLCHLELLNNGEGILYTSIPVEGMESMDVYQTIYLVAQLVKYHTSTLEKIEVEYDEQFVL